MTKHFAFQAAVFFLFGILFFPAHSASELSFADAYQRILERSTTLSNQEWNVESARMRRLASQGAFLPSLTLQASQVQSDPAYSPNGTQYLATAQINLFRFGHDLENLRAAGADFRKEMSQYRVSRQNVELVASKALFAFITNQQEVLVYERMLSSEIQLSKIAQERFRRGLLSRQEVATVQVERDNTEAHLDDSRLIVADNLSDLQTLLGLEPIHAEWPWKDVLNQNAALGQTQLNLELRPDWLAVSEDISAQHHRSQALSRSLLPSLDLSLNYGRSDVNFGDNHSFTTALTLSIPLLSGLADYSKYRIQLAAEQQALLNMENMKRAAPAKIGALQFKFNTALKSALGREKTLTVSRQLLEDNMQRFRLGRVSVNDIALDQRRLFQSELLAIAGWNSAHSVYVDLCHELGQSISPTGQCQ
jgi:outer membrane protein TolC